MAILYSCRVIIVKSSKNAIDQEIITKDQLTVMVSKAGAVEVFQELKQPGLSEKHAMTVVIAGASLPLGLFGKFGGDGC